MLSGYKKAVLYLCWFRKGEEFGIEVLGVGVVQGQA
jgi:hypothetical protein